MAILLNCHKVSKSFAGKTLFKNLSFGIETGNRIGLIGPNGAGKSTLLKIISQKLAVDNGQVTPQRGLRIGYLDQNPEFKPQATILDSLLEKVNDVHDSLAKAYEWLAILELNRFGENFLVGNLAGGWQKRVALARELILDPHLLLLDEPTNHLDVKSILWLESFLENSNLTYLMITHDRLFLQRTVRKIMDLDIRNPDFLLQVEGSYADFLEKKQAIIEGQMSKESAVKNLLVREVEWLRRGAKARQTKQKARIERAGDIKEEFNDLKQRNRGREISFEFSEVEKGPQKLVVADAISKSYGNNQVFKNFSYTITPRTRLALLGENGIGKSTLLKVLVGQESPDSGNVKLAEGLKVAYFEQKRETLNLKNSLLKNICPEGDYVNCQGQFIFARSYLERFQFRTDQMDLPVERLSGGEQSRLRLAQIMLLDCQVLVLDEPTNDLDVETLITLENALRNFQGAVILVTHDRYFMDQIATEILAMDQIENDTLVQFFSEYSQWENWIEEQKQLLQRNSVQTLDKEKNKREPNSDIPSSLRSSPKKMTFKEKFELEGIEARILQLESSLMELQTLSTSEELFKDHIRMQEVCAEIQSLQNEIEKQYERWSYLDSIKKANEFAGN